MVAFTHLTNRTLRRKDRATYLQRIVGHHPIRPLELLAMTENRDLEATLSVLVVDDEELLVRSCARILEHEGFAVRTATRGREALEIISRQRPDIILTDLMLPDIDGLELLQEARQLDPEAVVIMITGFATVDSSVAAIKAGAYDYIPKPFTATQLQILVGRAARQVRLARDNERLRDQLRERHLLDGVIGSSEPMKRLFELVQRVAPTDASVFITGESGTGKELIARALHRQSRRGEGPFVAVNCAAFPDALLESELFGHEKGAFTGADEARRGLMEAASGGTFFLDEISEMPLELQAKLLRVLQERQVRRVGGETETPIDIRVVAATNRDPDELVGDGLLRQDLFFRLNVVPLRVPPLRERKDDIPRLAQHFLRYFAVEYDRDGALPLRLSPDSMNVLLGHSWPGNVRELQNLMERVVTLATPGEEVRITDLAEEFQVASSGVVSADGVVDTTKLFHLAKEEAVEAFERTYLTAILAEHGGNISLAAREAGIDRKTIHRLLNKYGLKVRLEGTVALPGRN
jgi:DNA-binding NtrC family response regulator